MLAVYHYIDYVDLGSTQFKPVSSGSGLGGIPIPPGGLQFSIVSPMMQPKCWILNWAYSLYHLNTLSFVGAELVYNIDGNDPNMMIFRFNNSGATTETLSMHIDVSPDLARISLVQ